MKDSLPILLQILAVFVGLLYPLYAMIKAKETTKYLVDNPHKKIHTYKIVIITQWIFVVLLVVMWWSMDRSWDLLGLGFLSNIWWILSFLFTLALGTVLLNYLIRIPDSQVEAIQTKLSDVAFILPSNFQEYRWSIGLALTAGICEELLFRGFVYGELIHYVPVVAAIIITNVLFAIAHTGTKLKNMVGAFGLGVLCSTIYYFTNSLWIPMMLHALVDIYSCTLMVKLQACLQAFTVDFEEPQRL